MKYNFSCQWNQHNFLHEHLLTSMKTSISQVIFLYVAVKLYFPSEEDEKKYGWGNRIQHYVKLALRLTGPAMTRCNGKILQRRNLSQSSLVLPQNHDQSIGGWKSVQIKLTTTLRLCHKSRNFFCSFYPYLTQCPTCHSKFYFNLTLKASFI